MCVNQVTYCHCTGCESHYKTNQHTAKSPTLCGDFCVSEVKCQFSLFDAGSTRCYLYDQAQFSKITFIRRPEAKPYTCYKKG